MNPSLDTVSDWAPSFCNINSTSAHCECVNKEKHQVAHPSFVLSIYMDMTDKCLAVISTIGNKAVFPIKSSIWYCFVIQQKWDDDWLFGVQLYIFYKWLWPSHKSFFRTFGYFRKTEFTLKKRVNILVLVSFQPAISATITMSNIHVQSWFCRVRWSMRVYFV